MLYPLPGTGPLIKAVSVLSINLIPFLPYILLVVLHQMTVIKRIAPRSK